MGMFFHSADAVPERPADPAVRRANLRRIGPLFRPYKMRLGAVLLLIVVSAGLGGVPPFFLQHGPGGGARGDTTLPPFNPAARIVYGLLSRRPPGSQNGAPA